MQCPANYLDSNVIFIDVILQATLVEDISLHSRDQEQHNCSNNTLFQSDKLTSILY